MKLIVAIALLCILTKQVLSSEKGLGLDLEDVVKIEDITTTIKEDRKKDNDILKLGDRNSDKLVKSGDFEDNFSLRDLNEHETAFKYNDYTDDAERNDLAKSSNFDVRLKDESNIAKATEVHSKKGTDVEKAIKSKIHKGLDSQVYDSASIGAEHDSERLKSHDKKYGLENLLSDGYESIFDKGHNFEFGTFYRAYPKRIEPVISHPADSIILHPGNIVDVHPGDEILIHPGDEIIVRTDDDVIVNPHDIVKDGTPVDPRDVVKGVLPVDPHHIVEDAIPVDVPGVSGASLDTVERLGVVANIDTPRGLLHGRLADVFNYQRYRPFSL